MQFKVPFSGRAHNYTDDELEAVVSTARSAVPLTQGLHLREFEKKFKQYTDSEHAFAVCNATAALELAAQLCCFDDGDEVIIPSHTFTASAYPFVKKGAKIVWADIDINTRVVNVESVAKCISTKTKAIVVVHLYGYGVDMFPIMELARKHDILVIEDTAQALGVDVAGGKAGAFGDFGVFSFHSHKNVTTLGEGGVLTVKSPEVADIVPMLRHNGHCAFSGDREHYWIPAMGNVDLPVLNGTPLMPNNYCLGEVESALGTKLLDRIDQLNAEKRERAICFIDELASEFPELAFHRENSSRHNYHLLVAMVRENKRNKFIELMANKYAVQCVVQYYPLNRYDFYKKLGFGNAHCPNADCFFDNMVSFPFHHSLPDDDFEYVLDSTKKALKELRV